MLRRRLAKAERTLAASRSASGTPAAPAVRSEPSAEVPAVERSYRVLLDAIRAGAVTLTPQGIVLYANAHFADMLRLPLDQVIGGPFARFLPEEQRTTFETLADAARGQGAEGDIHLRRAWAENLSVHLSCRFLDDPGLQALCLVVEPSAEQRATETLRQASEELEAHVAARMLELAEANRALQDGNLSLEELNAQLEEEVLQRQQAETALRASEEKFRRVFESSPDYIVLFSLHSALVLDVNAAFERITGYLREEILDRSILELGILPDAEQRAHLLQDLAEQGFVRNREITLRKKSGELVIGLVACTIVEIGVERVIVAVVHDTTDRTRLEYQAAPHRG
jgi:PAS domain S-box-containing protein